MRSYQHLLAAVDLDGSGEAVLQRAHDLAKAAGAQLSVVHVVEYITLDTGEALIATPVDLTQQMVSSAQEQLTALCTKLGIPETSARVLSGPISLEILSLAKTLAADLIVVGHQPRRGFLASLFNHTEENVVSKAPCDVLAIKLQKPGE